MSFYLAEEPFLGIQGEGNTIGKQSLFIRFLKCCFRCEFCDSKHTWKKTDDSLFFEDIKELIDYLFKNNYLNLNISNIVFTGGEPLFYQEIMEEFDQLLCYRSDIKRSEITYEIETTLALPLTQDFLLYIRDNKERIQFNISPKLQFEYDKVIENLKFLDLFNINYILKFVDEYSKESRNEILTFIASVSFLLTLDRSKIFVMPECRTRDEHINRFEKTIEFCKDNGFSFSPRLHILLWSDKKRV